MTNVAAPRPTRGTRLRLGQAVVGVVVRPRTTMAALAGQRRVDLAFQVVLAYGILYTITAVLLARQHLQPLNDLLLPISRENYYTVQIFFTIPGVIVAWLLLAASAWAVLELTSPWGAPHERSDLPAVCAVVGMATALTWSATMWPVETLIAVLGPQYWYSPPGTPASIAVIGQSYLWVVTVASVAAATAGIRFGMGVRWPRAALAAAVGVLASSAFQAVLFR